MDTPEDKPAGMPERTDGQRAPAPERHARTGVRIEDAEGLDHRHKDIFFAAVETTRMPMIVTDPWRHDNPIVFANHAFLAMTGYTAEEILGTNCRFLQGPETDQATIAELRNAIAEKREFATEILNYRKDGYSFWNALFVSPVFDPNGELVYFFGSQLDVSRRREAEESLRQAHKMEALGRLTGGIAHDFNNLLQVMVGYLELIGSGLQKPRVNAERLLRNVENARSAADRASNLTQQLLSFARKQRLEGRILNLNDLLKSIKTLADRTLGDGVDVETRLDQTLANCRVDPTQVEVAILNILINARDAMANQSRRRLTIETKNLVIEQESLGKSANLGPGRYVAMVIADNGSGIPAPVLERVMDPFFTTKEEGKGTGLGLSMVYGFAKQSGGTAEVSSTEGVGTTVSIFFPAADETVGKTVVRSTRAMDRPGNETILVVEDRPDVAELARMILEDIGYTILRASNAREAMGWIEGDRTIDLLFSDLIMPGDMNGVALARAAKRLRSDLKVLLTTGYAEASLERTEAGGLEFDVLNKPYGRAELGRKVRVILDGPTGVT